MFIVLLSQNTDMTSKIEEHERSMSPPPPPTRGRSPRRGPGQSGYDSDTGVQQYYTSPTHRKRTPSPHDAWVRNPGGIPAQVRALLSRLFCRPFDL